MPLFIICIHHFLCIFQIFVFFLHFFICRNIMIRNFDLFISWLINMIWYFISWTQEQSLLFILISFVQFTQSCFTLCNPMDCSTTGFLVHHQLPELAQTHVCWLSDAIPPSHPLSSPSPPAFNHSQHQSLFKWVSSSHRVAKVLEFQLQHQSFQWTFRTDFL